MLRKKRGHITGATCLIEDKECINQISKNQSLILFLCWGAGREWGLNSGFCACKAGTLPLEPHLQSILPWLFWKWNLANHLPIWTKILLISVSQVVRITGVSHELRAPNFLLISTLNAWVQSNYLVVPDARSQGWRWQKFTFQACFLTTYHKSCFPNGFWTQFWKALSKLF
jgi:hypothetical protein